MDRSRDAIRTFGYCTNVHRVDTLESIQHALDLHARAVRSRVAPDEILPLGLWIPAGATSQLADESDIEAFGAWLSERGFEAFTLNGFPVDSFHDRVVKTRVYRPFWSDHQRIAYTTSLIRILRHLPGRRDRSISTLPVAWRGDVVDLEQAATDLRHMAAMMDWALDENEILLHLDLEPEPGCVLERSGDVVEFFARLASARDPGILKPPDLARHLGVCHDICHAAVMFEDQAAVLKRYEGAGICVGKVQVSSALRVPFDAYAPSERREAIDQLRSFAEDRWLHQTMVRFDDGEFRFFEDLPDAIAAFTREPRGEWRVHFHVPIHVERFGLLQTTQDEIAPALQAASAQGVTAFEVETYAWSVLPEHLRPATLAEGIADELKWAKAISR